MPLIRRSIRYILTLWSQGILAAILIVFSWVLYATFSAGLVQNANKELSLRAASVAANLLAFWQAERAAPLAGPGNWDASPSGTIEDVITAGQLPTLVARWAERTDGLQSGWPIRILDRAGRLIAESAGSAQLGFPVNDPAIAQAQQGQDVSETLRIHDQRVMLWTHPVIHDGRVRYLVQTAGSLQAVDQSLAELRTWLFWLTPLTLVATSAIGWFLATMALQPVGLMTAQARRIGAERLDERLPVPKTGDELERLATTFNDMLARLEQAFRRMRQFSAAASHELRTPLTVLKGELEVVLRRPRPPEEYRRVIETQLEIIDEMSHLVEELLMLARSDSIASAVEFKPIELGALVRQVSDLWRRPAESKGIHLDIATPEPLWVRGEARLLERVVGNLLDNAIRHTPSDGRVTLRSERFRDQVRVVVRDTGPGIPLDEIPHLFDRFFKPPATKAEGSSTGLGLGLCRWIVEAHAGRIEIVSPPNQGATFTVWFPGASAPS
jgi:heavy metal sensor kinase